MSSNSSLSWLDPQTLKDLATASGLSGGRGTSRVAATLPEKVALARPQPAARPGRPPTVASLKRALDEAEEHEPRPDETTRQALPPFKAPQAAMGARLAAFIDWLFRNLACVRVFIADGDGLPLAQRNSNIDLIGLATVLMDASRELRGHLQLPQEGAIGMELGPAESFQLLQIQTSWQEVSLGLIVRAGLSRETLDEVKAALHAAIEEEQPQASPIQTTGDGAHIPASAEVAEETVTSPD